MHARLAAGVPRRPRAASAGAATRRHSTARGRTRTVGARGAAGAVHPLSSSERRRPLWAADPAGHRGGRGDRRGVGPRRRAARHGRAPSRRPGPGHVRGVRGARGRRRGTGSATIAATITRSNRPAAHRRAPRARPAQPAAPRRRRARLRPPPAARRRHRRPPRTARPPRRAPPRRAPPRRARRPRRPRPRRRRASRAMGRRPRRPPVAARRRRAHPRRTSRAPADTPAARELDAQRSLRRRRGPRPPGYAPVRAHVVEEALVQARVAAQLGMEGNAEQAALAGRDGVSVDGREQLDARPVLADPRRPDEHRAQRSLAEPGHVEIRLEGMDLTPERIAIAAHVHDRQVIAIEHDQAGAGAEDRDATRGERAQRRGEPLALDPERHRRRLAAGHHQPVEPVEIGRHAHLARPRAELAEHAPVRREAALEREHPDERPVVRCRLRRVAHRHRVSDVRAATSRAARAAARLRASSSRGSPSRCRDRTTPPPHARRPPSGWSPRRSPGPGAAGPAT